MKTATNLIFWVLLFCLIDVLMEFLGVEIVSLTGVLLYCVAAFGIVVWLAVLSKRTEVVLITDKAVFVRGRRKYTVFKTDNGCVFANYNEVLIKSNAAELDRNIKVGRKYRITSYKINLFGDRNILFATEIKSSVRRKSEKKSK